MLPIGAIRFLYCLFIIKSQLLIWNGNPLAIYYYTLGTWGRDLGTVWISFSHDTCISLRFSWCQVMKTYFKVAERKKRLYWFMELRSSGINLLKAWPDSGAQAMSVEPRVSLLPFLGSVFLCVGFTCRHILCVVAIAVLILLSGSSRRSVRINLDFIWCAALAPLNQLLWLCGLKTLVDQAWVSSQSCGWSCSTGNIEILGEWKAGIWFPRGRL